MVGNVPVIFNGKCLDCDIPHTKRTAQKHLELFSKCSEEKSTSWPIEN